MNTNTNNTTTKTYKLSKEMTKKLSLESYYDEEQFIKDCKTYIKALKSGRLQYTVTHVSSSGMSRDINIQSFEGSMTKGYFRSYNMMLTILGYSFAKHSNDIKVSGCGMNILFATNYDIIHTFKRMGLIKNKTCEVLAQKIN